MDLSQILNFLTLIGIVGGSGAIWLRIGKIEGRMNGTSDDLKKLKSDCPIFSNVKEPKNIR